MTTSESLPFFALEDSVELDTNQNWKDYNPGFILDLNAAYQGSPSSPQSCDSSSVSGTDDNGTPVSPATSTPQASMSAATAAAPGVSFAVMNGAGNTPAVLPLSAYFPLSDAKFIKAEPAVVEPHATPNGAALGAPVIPIGPLAMLPTLPPISNGAVDVDTIRELLKEQDVKKQRLARKAELARMSRKRKKVRMTDLEDEVDRLKEELERAHKKLKLTEEKLVEVQMHVPTQAPPPPPPAAVAAPPVSAQEEAKQLYNAMRFAAARRSEDDLKQMPVLASAAVNLIKKRNATAQSHLTAMKEHTELALPLRFLEWAMSKSDNFFTDPSGLWSSLFNREIGLSQQQLERLMALRKQNQPQATTADVEMAFAEFQKRMEGNMQLAETYLGAVTEILSPEQLVKFFGWVDQFGPVCVKINL